MIMKHKGKPARIRRMTEKAMAVSQIKLSSNMGQYQCKARISNGHLVISNKIVIDKANKCREASLCRFYKQAACRGQREQYIKFQCPQLCAV